MQRPRRPWFASVVAGFGAACTGVLGVLFLLAPDEWARQVDLVLESPLARSDIRTVYGGLEVGLAVLIACWLWSSEVRAAVALHLAIWGGLAGGRAIGLMTAEEPAAAGLGLFLIEVAGLVLGILAWLTLRAPTAEGALMSDGEVRVAATDPGAPSAPDTGRASIGRRS